MWWWRWKRLANAPQPFNGVNLQEFVAGMLGKVNDAVGSEISSTVSGCLCSAAVSKRDASWCVARFGGLFAVAHVFSDVEGVSVG